MFKCRKANFQIERSIFLTCFVLKPVLNQCLYQHPFNKFCNTVTYWYFHRNWYINNFGILTKLFEVYYFGKYRFIMASRTMHSAVVLPGIRGRQVYMKHLWRRFTTNIKCTTWLWVNQSSQRDLHSLLSSLDRNLPADRAVHVSLGLCCILGGEAGWWRAHVGYQGPDSI